MRTTTWRGMISREMESRGESFLDTEKCVVGQPPHVHREEDVIPTEDWLDREFNCGYGSAEGHAFTLWTKNRVYFPTEYDGAEGVASVPRNPCDEVTCHV